MRRVPRDHADERANREPERLDGPNVVSMMERWDVASGVVVPAMRAVFNVGEVTAFELSVADDNGSVALSLTAGGDKFEYFVIQGHVPGMGAKEWSENLRSLLVDFVAESRVGWGEDRDVRCPMAP